MNNSRLLPLVALGSLVLSGALLLSTVVLSPAQGSSDEEQLQALGKRFPEAVRPEELTYARPRDEVQAAMAAAAQRAADATGARAVAAARHGQQGPGPLPPEESHHTGRRVEFPEFLPPATISETPFNPSAHVESRVARLYYIRDAHRVAQIINRTVHSYNYAAKNLAERDAAQARLEADEWTQERRAVEFQAMRSAQNLREAEQELGETERQLESLEDSQQQQREIRAQLEATNVQIDRLDASDPQNQQRLIALENTKTQLAAQLASSQERGGGDAARRDDLEQTQQSLRNVVAGLRQQVRELEARTIAAQGHEDRARDEQFRREVAAAHTDPDTYAPGKKNSQDPVAQVSVSVIGEGVIQLRGPIKGINKIRHMINQIDSPLGQIKIGIETIQVNGEKGNRMERVIGRIEAQLDLARYMTSQSLLMLRRAIQMEAAQVAESTDQGGHYQVDRDRKYLYQFFGRDFVDELYAMDSEFLHTENKVLSIHSMDTISLNRALFVLALAKNDVRQRILANFLSMARQELPQAEYDFRKAACLYPFKVHSWQKHFTPGGELDARMQEVVFQNAFQRYHFRNLIGHFDNGVWQTDTLNPMQREFLRLAQIFKSQMIAEVELKQRVIERGLISAENEQNRVQLDQQRMKLRRTVLGECQTAYEKQFKLGRELVTLLAKVRASTKQTEYQGLELQTTRERVPIPKPPAGLKAHAFEQLVMDVNLLPVIDETLDTILKNSPLRAEQQAEATAAQQSIRALQTRLPSPEAVQEVDSRKITNDEIMEINETATALELLAMKMVELARQNALRLDQALQELTTLLTSDRFEQSKFDAVAELFAFIRLHLPNENGPLYPLLADFTEKADLLQQELASLSHMERTLTRTRAPLDHIRLLDHLIDEHEEKYIELLEGTRSHIAAVDNYLKRLAIAIEDDLKVQFNDPAFVQIRGAAREWDVTLGQVERTTILTNNRAFAKVTPQATMEFDLPKRQIAIVEAMEGARALAEDYGALLEDPTFLAAFQMMGGSEQPQVERNQYSSLPTNADEHQLRHSDAPQEPSDSALQALVPEPEIYKFETGTGFEIRPVIQPDGDSVVYDFHYMYTTHVREPVDPDEKHLGRIKRHFVDTQVQTSSFEMREISRYQVALKAARTSRGVPLFENIPVVGVLFRPAPSAESSIQQNIILGRSVVYPTLFDLMGLRWASQVVDLNHTGVKDGAHVVRGRNQTVTDFVFERASARVDQFLNVEHRNPTHYRPDLYHRQRQPSPYHPGGYQYDKQRGREQPIYDERGKNNVEDPAGRNFRIHDRRPIELQQPPYDDRFGAPLQYEDLQLEPVLAPPVIDTGSRTNPPQRAIQPASHNEPPRRSSPGWRRLPPPRQ